MNTPPTEIFSVDIHFFINLWGSYWDVGAINDTNHIGEVSYSEEFPLCCIYFLHASKICNVQYKLYLLQLTSMHYHHHSFQKAFYMLACVSLFTL